MLVIVSRGAEVYGKPLIANPRKWRRVQPTVIGRC